MPMPLNVLDCFWAFLNMSEEALKLCVDFYNSGKLAEPARIALEAVAALSED